MTHYNGLMVVIALLEKAYGELDGVATRLTHDRDVDICVDRFTGYAEDHIRDAIADLTDALKEVTP